MTQCGEEEQWSGLDDVAARQEAVQTDLGSEEYSVTIGIVVGNEKRGGFV